MNSTRWVTLSAFIQYLGRSGICHVDETEKGWFIAWIDNSPKALARSDAAKKKERQDMNDEERQRRMLAEQMERAKALEQGGDAEAGPSGVLGEERAPDEKEPEEDIDISTIQPIKLSIGGGGLDKGKGREQEVKAELSTAVPVDGTDVGESSSAATECAAEVKEAIPSTQSTTIAAPTISAPKPKVNAFKLASKPNPLKVNPLKAAKASSDSASQAGSSSGSAKRPISAVEAIIMEDMEKKKRRENSTWSGARGHGKEGLQRRG
jgi:DNA/RNA-binding protein KIN17